MANLSEKKFLSKLFDKLFPINRSILGEGYRLSLKILKSHINFKELKYPTGKKIFDWKVPNEWVIKDAYIKFKNIKIVDFKKNNLSVVNYSAPINKKLEINKLKKYLHSDKKNPKAIPYVTSYYKKRWGFCLPDNQKKNLKKGQYHCYINSYFKNGVLVNGYTELKGRSKKINLITSYLCHPSLANNELSGPLVLLGLYKKIQKWKKRNFTYQFLINPETIGSLCFLHSHYEKIKKDFNSGLVLTCLGGPQKKLSYKLSKNGNSSLDKLFIRLNKKNKVLIREFDAGSGSDERQFNSPGFNLPVGNVCRSVYGEYREYHSSLDTKKFMNISKIQNSINELEEILKLHDKFLPIKRHMPHGELMLSKRSLYPALGTLDEKKYNSGLLRDKESLYILMNLLSYSDGVRNLIDIVEQKKLNLKKSSEILDLCIKLRLLKFS